MCMSMYATEQGSDYSVLSNSVDNLKELVTETETFKKQQMEWKNVLFSGISLEKDCHCFYFPLQDKCYKCSMSTDNGLLSFMDDINVLSKSLTYHFGGYYDKQGWLLNENVRFNSPVDFLKSPNLQEVTQKKLFEVNREVMQDFKECAKLNKLWDVMNDKERITSMVELRKKKNLSTLNVYEIKGNVQKFKTYFEFSKKAFLVLDKKNNQLDLAKLFNMDKSNFEHSKDEFCELLVHPAVKKVNLCEKSQLAFWVKNGHELNNTGYMIFASEYSGITIPKEEKVTKSIVDKLQFEGKDVTIDMMKSMVFNELEGKRLKPLSLNKIKERMRNGKKGSSLDVER